MRSREDLAALLHALELKTEQPASAALPNTWIASRGRQSDQVRWCSRIASCRSVCLTFTGSAPTAVTCGGALVVVSRS